MKQYPFAIALVALSLSVSGQSDTTKIIPIQEITVTSQRTPRENVSIPYSVSLLDRKEIGNISPRTTPEALMSSSGVFIQKTNHGGGSPFVRGLTGNQTLMLIDGIRLNNSIYRYGPNQYLNTIDVLTVDKIEVAKGTGSVQYGSDALGGTIQIFTKEPEFSDQNELRGSLFGKYMTGDMEKTGRGELRYSSEKISAIAGGTWHDYGDLIGGKNTGKQSPSGYKEIAFDAKLNFALRENMQLSVAHQYLQQNHVPVYHKVVLENYGINEFDPQRRMLTYARLNISGKKPLFSQIKITTSWQQGVEGRISRKNGSSTLVNEKDQINTLGFTAEVQSQLNNFWTASSGIEIYHDKVGSAKQDVNTSSGVITPKRGLYPDQSNFASYSVFTLHRLDFQKWIIDGGIRLNGFRINLTDATIGDITISPEALVFNAAAMYNFSEAHHAYATMSSGFRAPNIDDMGTLGIVDFRYEVPAYDLKPEKSVNYEIGYKLSLPKFSGMLAAYYMNLDQLITRVKVDGEFINGYQVYRKENVEEAYIQGLETTVKWIPLPELNFNGGLSYTYGQNVTKKEPMRRIPPLNGRLAATWTRGKFFTMAEFLFAARQDRLAQGDIDDNRIQDDGTPAWQVLNLFAGIELAPVTLNLGVQNLFNEDYRTHGSGINGMGRSAWISATWCF